MGKVKARTAQQRAPTLVKTLEIKNIIKAAPDIAFMSGRGPEEKKNGCRENKCK